MNVEDFFNLLKDAVLLAGIYAAMSMGMTVIYGVMKIVNLAHAGFMMLGAYFAFELYYLPERLPASWVERFPLLGHHVDPILGATLALPTFFLFGMGVYWLLVRWLPRSDQPTLASLLLMFGFWQVLQNAGYLIWKNEDRSIFTARTISPPLHLVSQLLRGPAGGLSGGRKLRGAAANRDEAKLVWNVRPLPDPEPIGLPDRGCKRRKNPAAGLWVGRLPGWLCRRPARHALYLQP